MIARIGILVLVLLAVTVPAAHAATATYAAINAEQVFTVPAGVCTVTVHAVGASGVCNASFIGRGGDVVATLLVIPGQLLYVEVGGNGGYDGLPQQRADAGGFNGGGSGGSTIFSGGYGGGATDVRTAPASAGNTLASRQVVAGGGGGGGVQNPICGGDAGGSRGGAPPRIPGVAETATAGGAGGTSIECSQTPRRERERRSLPAAAAVRPIGGGGGGGAHDGGGGGGGQAASGPAVAAVRALPLAIRSQRSASTRRACRRSSSPGRLAAPANVAPVTLVSSATELASTHSSSRPSRRTIRRRAAPLVVSVSPSGRAGRRLPRGSSTCGGTIASAPPAPSACASAPQAPAPVGVAVVISNVLVGNNLMSTQSIRLSATGGALRRARRIDRRERA